MKIVESVICGQSSAIWRFAVVFAVDGDFFGMCVCVYIYLQIYIRLYDGIGRIRDVRMATSEGKELQEKTSIRMDRLDSPVLLESVSHRCVVYKDDTYIYHLFILTHCHVLVTSITHTYCQGIHCSLFIVQQTLRE